MNRGPARAHAGLAIAWLMLAAAMFAAAQTPDDGGASERASAGHATGTQGRPTDDGSPGEVGQRLRRTRPADSHAGASAGFFGWAAVLLALSGGAWAASVAAPRWRRHLEERERIEKILDSLERAQRARREERERNGLRPARRKVRRPASPMPAQFEGGVSFQATAARARPSAEVELPVSPPLPAPPPPPPPPAPLPRPAASPALAAPPAPAPAAPPAPAQTAPPAPAPAAPPAPRRSAPVASVDGGAPEQARAGRAGSTESRSSLDDMSSREAGERLRRTHPTDEAPADGRRPRPADSLARLLEAIAATERRLDALREEVGSTPPEDGSGLDADALAAVASTRALTGLPVDAGSLGQTIDLGPLELPSPDNLDVGVFDEVSDQLLARLQALGGVAARDGSIERTVNLGPLELPGGETLDLGRLDIPDALLERLSALAEEDVGERTVNLGTLELPDGEKLDPGTLVVVPDDLLARLQALADIAIPEGSFTPVIPVKESGARAA